MNKQKTVNIEKRTKVLEKAEKRDYGAPIETESRPVPRAPTCVFPAPGFRENPQCSLI